MEPTNFGREAASTWVVGLGSDHGDDCAGWEVITQLQAKELPGVRLLATSDPLAIAAVPPDCELLVVIDACRGAGPPGSIHRFTWPDSRLIVTEELSSHGLGLVAAFQLAEALGKLPPRVVVFAVEAELVEPGSIPNPPILAAIPELVARVLAETAASTGRTE